MRHTTLVFLQREGEILLAMKKVRFGAGKWNGPGGKVEAGESYEQAAIRECQEEIGVTPRGLQKVGELHFHDLPDTEHYCHIYVTTEWDETPSESEEMRPQWFKLTDIPYDQMWPDDKTLDTAHAGAQAFKGTVTIEDDRLTENTIHEVATL